MTRSTTVRRIPAAGLLALVALALSSGALASAADPPAGTDAQDAAIEHALPSKGAVRLLVSVPGTEAIDLAHVTASIGGSDVEATATAASSTDEVSRTSVLAIDTSASMAGARIAEAKKAATTYLATVPDNVKVGVLTFDDTVRLVVPPGLDREAARAAVADVRLTKQTALYDGVLGALKASGPSGADAGQRKILLLSDGKDTTDTDLSTVVRAIKKSGAGIDVVSLQSGDEASQPLKEIAAAGKGSVLTTADPAALTAAFAREADVLARQVVVTAKVPSDDGATSADVAVTVPTSSQSYEAAAYLPVRPKPDKGAEKVAAAVPTPVTAGPLDLPRSVMIGAVGAIGVGLIGVIAALAMGSSKPATHLTLSEHVSAYGVMAVPGHSGPRQDGAATAPGALKDQARQVAEKTLANNKNLEARISSALEGAGLDLRPSEWLLLRAGITVGGGLLGLLIGAGSVVIGLLLVLAAIFGPTLYLKLKKARRLGAFGTALADTLQLMSGSLSAGLSLGQSIDTIVREGNEPIASEFRRVVVESRLGVTLEDSLEGVAQRMQSKDFEWVVMAIRIQRQVGGNLAELLLTVAATLREREYLRRHVKALSAEGRLSAYILGGLPPVFLIYLTLSKPDYVHPLWTTPIGWIMCVGMALLLGVGIFWMAKVAKVDL
jgi:tight adherence protein B